MPDSPLTTYSDTTPQKRQITDVISLIDPSDAPLVEALGGLDGAAGKFRFVNSPSTTAEWLEDTLAALADSITESIASNTTALTVNDASVFQEGHIVLIDSEQMWVSSVDVAGEVVAVTRNYSGTQASHADNAAIEIIGMARLEGDDSDDVYFTDRTVGSNYTQIFHKEVKVSRTQRDIAQYGIADEMEYQENKSVPELMRLVEKQIFVGARKQGSATTPRAFGGLGTFITNNTVSVGGALTKAKIQEGVQAAYDDGGMGPWILPLNSANMEVAAGLFETTAYLRVDMQTARGGMVLKGVDTPFGQVNFLLDRWARTGTSYLLDTKHAGLKTYHPFTAEPLAKTGDADKSQVVGEFTLCVRQDKAHAALTAIS